jgi:protoporphyrinogen oxidase
MKIAIIGGGLTGLALADRLLGPGRTITVFERESKVGGLATWHHYGDFVWDRFYHVILPSDRHLIGFLHRLGLGEKLRWTRTFTGFYVDRSFHSMSSGMDFLRFRPISMVGKLRLAFTILYCSRLANWQRLESVAVGDWLHRLSGTATYEKIWRPLLLAKLGENYRRVSAVFIWSYIKRMFSARDPSTQKEHLGYVSGGYKAVFSRIEERLRQAGGTIHTGVAVRQIAASTCSGVTVRYNETVERFDKVVFTGPVSALRAVVSSDLCRIVHPQGADVEYLGVICAVLVTRKPLLPYYVLNIADERVPFTGVIGMSNLVSIRETAGLHITYLPKYVHSEDPMLRESDESLEKRFLSGVSVMFPDFDVTTIVSVHINRASKVQPLQVIGYSQLVPTAITAHPDFFVLNTSQFAANTLNNNDVIRSVEQFIELYGGSFEFRGIHASFANHEVEGIH